MIKQLAPVILAAALLSGCSTPAATTAPSATTADAQETPVAVPEVPAAPETTEASVSELPPEAATFAEALAFAKQDHAAKLPALAAMISLHLRAKEELKPAMSEDAWSDLELLRIKTLIGATNDNLTEREILLAVRQYTAAMELEAVQQGKA